MTESVISASPLLPASSLAFTVLPSSLYVMVTFHGVSVEASRLPWYRYVWLAPILIVDVPLALSSCSSVRFFVLVYVPASCTSVAVSDWNWFTTYTPVCLPESLAFTYTTSVFSAAP